MNNLLAISPIDGRYHDKTIDLVEYFSEAAIIKNRLIVEIEYLIALKRVIPKVAVLMSDDLIKKLRSIPKLNMLDNALAVKEIENKTKHDVKAIEYFLINKLTDFGVPELANFVHFGLTSQDICSVALSNILLACHKDVVLEKLQRVLNSFMSLTQICNNIKMMSRTHGQPASPTFLDKEIKVFCYRLNSQMHDFYNIKLTAKFGGAVGNFNAHFNAYPSVNWSVFANDFVEQFSLSRSLFTTQVDGNDAIVAYFDIFKRINNILIDFSRDIWQYISFDYFKLSFNKREVGSSTMPHKINPIDFENAEGNLGIANAMFEHIGSKIQISRLQRDLTDSTILRNVGVPIAHSILAYDSLVNGMSKLQPNNDAIFKDLNNNWAIITEGIQTILKREGYKDAYEKLKDFSRNNDRITELDINRFVVDLDVPDILKLELFKLTPFTYIGI